MRLRPAGLSVVLLISLLVVSCSERNMVEPANDSPVGTEREVEIPAGGQLVFPAGGLSEGTSVTATASSEAPLLPVVEAAGDWFRVEIEGSLLRPAEFRLPIPPGQDRDRLIIVQVEDDGQQIFLSTRIEGENLVAFMPGVGTSALYDLRLRSENRLSNGARFVTGILFEDPVDLGEGLPEVTPPVGGEISGPDILQTGREGRYRLTKGRGRSASTSDHRWMAVGGQLTEVAEHSQTEVSRDDEGLIDLMVDYVCQSSGTRGFTSMTISVQDDVPETDGVTMSGPTSVDRGEEFELWAWPEFAADRWGWDFGDGTSDSATRDPSRSYFILPPHSYAEAGTYTVTVSAEGPGRSGFAVLEVEVTDPTFEIIGTGGWLSSPRVSGVSATIRNGVEPFIVQWKLHPGPSSDPVQTSDRNLRWEVSFDQPGTYLLTTSATDNLGNEAQRTSLLAVFGAVEGRALVSVAADQAFTNQPVGATLTIDGGTLVANGILGAYRARIYWGDDESTSLFVEAPNPDIGATIEVEHSYARAGDYEIGAEITDAHGRTFDAESDQISIQARESYISAVASLDATENGALPIDITFDSDFLSRFTNGCQTGCLTAIAYAGPTGDPQSEARLDLYVADNASVGTHDWGPDIDRGGMAEIYFTTPRVRRTSGGNLVVWETVAVSSGGITLDEFGTASGSLVRGSFAANVHGFQSVDGSTTEEVFGTITGSFELIRP